MYFPCHNDGHLEEKLLFQCNLASYFVFLNLFSIRAVFLKHPVLGIDIEENLVRDLGLPDLVKEG